MAETVRRQPFFWGIALVVVGVVLLVRKLGLVSISWLAVVSAGMVIAALLVIVRRFRTHGNGVFWPALVFCYGLITFVHTTGLIPISPWYGFPLMLISIGLALGANVALRPGDWHVAVPAVLLLGTGSAIALSEMGLIDEDAVRSAISACWPFALIAFGAALLLNWRGRSAAAP